MVTRRRIWTDPYLSPSTKLKSKWIQNLNKSHLYIFRQWGRSRWIICFFPGTHFSHFLQHCAFPFVGWLCCLGSTAVLPNKRVDSDMLKQISNYHLLVQETTRTQEWAHIKKSKTESSVIFKGSLKSLDQTPSALED